jgi:hypothetical protein
MLHCWSQILGSVGHMKKAYHLHTVFNCDVEHIQFNSYIILEEWKIYCISSVAIKILQNFGRKHRHAVFLNENWNVFTLAIWRPLGRNLIQTSQRDARQRTVNVRRQETENTCYRILQFFFRNWKKKLCNIFCDIYSLFVMHGYRNAGIEKT